MTSNYSKRFTFAVLTEFFLSTLWSPLLWLVYQFANTAGPRLGKWIFYPANSVVSFFTHSELAVAVTEAPVEVAGGHLVPCY